MIHIYQYYYSSLFHWGVLYMVQQHPKQSRNCNHGSFFLNFSSSYRSRRGDKLVAIALLQLGDHDLNLGVFSLLLPSQARFSFSFYP